MGVDTRVLKVFTDVLEIRGDVRTSDLRYNDSPKWNSLAHITLISALEQEFDILIDTDDILAMSSYDKAIEIVSKYVQVA